MRRLERKEFADIARKKGGRLLTKAYVNRRTHMLYECASGHTWWATGNSIKFSNSWCPHCDYFLGESLVREILEQIFEVEFKKSFPQWLKSKEGTQLELDGYNEELKLAYEYQGRQHYKRIKMWQSKEQFRRQKQLDKRKERLCREVGVTLIVVPTYEFKNDIKKLVRFIFQCCKDSGIKISKTNEDLNIDMQKVFISGGKRKYIDLKSKAKAKGWELIEPTYLGSKSDHEMICDKGHTIKKKPENMHQGCHGCAPTKRKTVEDMQDLALAKGGVFLPKKYLGMWVAQKFMCNAGHIFLKRPGHIKQRGDWCLEC